MKRPTGLLCARRANTLVRRGKYVISTMYRYEKVSDGWVKVITRVISVRDPHYRWLATVAWVPGSSIRRSTREKVFGGARDGL